MWALVVNNAGIMGAFLHCNLEDIRTARSVDAQHPEIFSGILVGLSLFSIIQLSQLLTLANWWGWPTLMMSHAAMQAPLLHLCL